MNRNLLICLALLIFCVIPGSVHAQTGTAFGDAAAETVSDSAISAKLSCSQATASMHRSKTRSIASSALFAPWGVQLAGSFSKSAALAAYKRAQSSYAALLGTMEPMVIGGRVPSLGFAPYYRVRVPASSRAAAEALCGKILRAGGACAVPQS